MNKSGSMQVTPYARFAQIVVGLAGVFYLLTGIALLFAPVWFFQTIGHFPPFNRHYEGDLGSFLLPLGVGLLVAARAPLKHIWVIWVAALGSLLHAGNHVYDAVVGAAAIGEWVLEIGPLLVLALVLVVVAWGSSSSDARESE